MRIYLAGYMLPIDLLVVVVIGIIALAPILYCIKGGAACPGWLNRLIEANANIYRAIPLPAIPILVVLYIGWMSVSVAVLSLAVVGGTYVMSDPNYPALLEEFPWFEWVMFTAVELFALGIRIIGFIGMASPLLAAYHIFSSKRGLKKCEQ